MNDFKIISVSEENLDQYGLFCVKNKKHPGYVAKSMWLQKRFKEGMRLKILQSPDGKQAGFIEYIPGKFTWRVVNAENHFVIHCLWVNSKLFHQKGLASKLINDCIDDAKKNKASGVAVVTSDGSWMASKDIYLKNGFEVGDAVEPHFQLLVKSFESSAKPSFPQDFEKRKKKYKGLQLVYTDQCPFISKAVKELPPVAKKYNIDLKLVEIKDSNIARKEMLSPYGMINLIYNGRLLADHAISATRFKNILERELNMKQVNS